MDDAVAEITRLIVNGSKLQAASDRKAEFRCSSLPFCAIRAFLEMDKPTMSFGMDFYVRIGTAVHEVMQTWLPRAPQGGRVFGAWKCRKCKHEHTPQLQPRRCDSCKHKDLEYVEVTIKYRGLSGHCDFIYEWAKGKFVLVDFKTTSLLEKKMKFPGAWKSKYPSSPGYEVQVKAYATLLRELFGLNITHAILIFVDRAKVIQSASDFHPVVFDWNKAKHEEYLAKIDEACDNYERLERLQTRIQQADDFSPKAMKTLKAIVANRPCQDMTSWHGWMKKGFYKGECPLLTSCMSGNRACLNAVLRELEK